MSKKRLTLYDAKNDMKMKVITGFHNQNDETQSRTLLNQTFKKFASSHDVSENIYNLLPNAYCRQMASDDQRPQEMCQIIFDCESKRMGVKC